MYVRPPVSARSVSRETLPLERVAVMKDLESAARPGGESGQGTR